MGKINDWVSKASETLDELKKAESRQDNFASDIQHKFRQMQREFTSQKEATSAEISQMIPRKEYSQGNAEINLKIKALEEMHESLKLLDDQVTTVMDTLDEIKESGMND